jgi:hypothetical protein
MTAICSDIYTIKAKKLPAINIALALGYQLLYFDLSTNDYQDILFPLLSDKQRSAFEKKWCNKGKLILPITSNQSANQNTADLEAQALVEKNTQLQDSCYSTRTFNGDDPVYARNLCIARYPNSLQWAKSSNHKAEDLCYFTRVSNGTNEIDARNLCLAKYPIR